MPDDFLRLDAPAAQTELALLRAVKVGDVRNSPFFPAIPTSVKWTCLTAGDVRWEFEALFCGEPLMRVEIAELPSRLVLSIQETP